MSGNLSLWVSLSLSRSLAWPLVNSIRGALRGNSPSGAARALNAGVDVEMGSTIWVEHLRAAVQAGQTSEANVTQAVRRALRPLFRAGRFDPIAEVEWAQLPLTIVNSTEHQRVAYDAALQVRSFE
eukprot:SAG31_NODE_10403_length_1143_cov_0.738506_2_plen_126_part_00